MKSALVLLTAMIATAAASYWLEPRAEAAIATVPLSGRIPKEFSRWREEQHLQEQVGLTTDEIDPTKDDDALYDDVLMRTYRRDDGARVMLALAYGRRQRQELKIHRPALCYYGQGFQVRVIGNSSLALSEHAHVRLQTLLATNRARIEPVTYWIRIGNEITQNAWRTRWVIFSEGIRGRIPDGVLVRVSSLIDNDHDMAQALELQRAFLTDLYRHLTPSDQQLLAGVPAEQTRVSRRQVKSPPPLVALSVTGG